MTRWRPRIFFFASILPIAWLLEEAPAYFQAAYAPLVQTPSRDGDAAARALCDLGFGFVFVSIAASWLGHLTSPSAARRNAVTLVARLCMLGAIGGCLLVLDGVSSAHALLGDHEAHDGDVRLRAYRAAQVALGAFLVWSVAALASRPREARSVLLWIAPGIHAGGIVIVTYVYWAHLGLPLYAE